jgi:hypothetical protein
MDAKGKGWGALDRFTDHFNPLSLGGAYQG